MFRFADKYSQPLLSSLLGEEGFSQVLSQNKVLWMKLLLSILFIISSVATANIISSVATAKESTAELSGKFNAGDLSLHVNVMGEQWQYP